MNRIPRVWLFPLFAAGSNVAGILAVAAAQLELRLAGRNPFPFDIRLAVIVVLLTVLPLVGSAMAARGTTYGLAALLLALTVPASLLAAFVALVAGMYAVWGQVDLPLVLVALFLASALFLVGGVVAVIASRATFDALLQRLSTRAGSEDD